MLGLITRSLSLGLKCYPRFYLTHYFLEKALYVQCYNEHEHLISCKMVPEVNEGLYTFHW